MARLGGVLQPFFDTVPIQGKFLKDILPISLCFQSCLFYTNFHQFVFHYSILTASIQTKSKSIHLQSHHLPTSGVSKDVNIFVDTQVVNTSFNILPYLSMHYGHLLRTKVNFLNGVYYVRGFYIYVLYYEYAISNLLFMHIHLFYNYLCVYIISCKLYICTYNCIFL